MGGLRKMWWIWDNVMDLGKTRWIWGKTKYMKDKVLDLEKNKVDLGGKYGGFGGKKPSGF